IRFARNASSGCIRKSLEAAHPIVYQQSVWPTIDGIMCGRLSISGTRWCGNTNAPLTIGSPKRGPMAKTHCAVTHQSEQDCASRKFPARMQRCCISYSTESQFHRSEEHTSELQSHLNLVCRLLLEKKKNVNHIHKKGHVAIE